MKPADRKEHDVAGGTSAAAEGIIALAEGVGAAPATITMSFFDDEPTDAEKTGRHETVGRAPRGPASQTVMTRRLAFAGIGVVLLLVLVIGIKGCIDSQTTSQLKEFNRKASDIISSSNNTVSKPFFKAIQGASTKSPTELQGSVNDLAVEAATQVKQAQRLDAPDELKQAKSDLVLSMQLRQQGIEAIAKDLQTALSRNSADSQRAVNDIAAQMRTFDGADVVYAARVSPAISKALDDQGITVGAGGEQIAASSFLPTWQWLNPAYVTQQLSGGSSSSGAAATPGTHGHSLDSVSAGGQDLSPDTTNSIPGSPPPAFGVTFTNGGSVDESNVQITVKIEGGPSPISVTKVVARSAAGQQQTVQVPLASAPPIGQQVTVTVTVGTVPGETNADNNSLSFPVTFT